MSVPADISRREFLAGSAAAVPATRGLARGVSFGRGGPYSVVVVRVDQLRAGALGCYGADYGQSPNIDRFARTASLHRSCFSTEPVCSASRTAFDTGLHTFATVNGELLSPGDVTIHGLLRAAGYFTFHVGKWHKTPSSLSNSLFPERVPGTILGGLDYHAGHERKHLLVNDYYWVNGGFNAQPAGSWRPAKHTELFIQQLDAVPAGTPFYGILDLEPPHTPYGPITGTPWDVFSPGQVPAPPNVPPADIAKAEQQLAQYYGMTLSCDEQFGRVLRALRSRGLLESTLVIFTSDHGAHVGAHGLLSSSNQKRSMYEEALHVPLVVQAPWTAAGDVRGLFGTVDFMPLILSAAGLEPPSASHARFHPPGARYCQQLDPNNTPTGLAWRGVVSEDGLRYARNEAGPWVLFDVVEDPFNETNLIGTGDPREAELDALLHEAAALVGDVVPW